MKPFLTAVSFLTILPLPARTPEDGEVRASVRFFPLVGLLVGLAMSGVAEGLLNLLPALPAAALLTLALVGVSGGLHLDGLADTADGLLSSRPRERMLEIMRDSHIGTMGVFAVVGVLLVKMSALAYLMALPARFVVLAVALMPLAGRTALVVGLCLQPYVRAEGLGRAYFESRSPREAAWAAIVLVGGGVLFAGVAGVAASLTALAWAWLWTRYTHRRLGGGTGDTVGAGCEIAEAIVPLAILAVLRLRGMGV